jgi:hypothetical protein
VAAAVPRGSFLTVRGCSPRLILALDAFRAAALGASSAVTLLSSGAPGIVRPGMNCPQSAGKPTSAGYRSTSASDLDPGQVHVSRLRRSPGWRRRATRHSYRERGQAGTPASDPQPSRAEKAGGRALSSSGPQARTGSGAADPGPFLLPAEQWQTGRWGERVRRHTKSSQFRHRWFTRTAYNAHISVRQIGLGPGTQP